MKAFSITNSQPPITSFVFPKQIQYVLCIPGTNLLYAGYSENPKQRMESHFRQMNSQFSGSQLSAYTAFRKARNLPSPIAAANVFLIPVSSVPGCRTYGLACERRLLPSFHFPLNVAHSEGFMAISCQVR